MIATQTNSGRQRVVVDTARCQGYGLCVAIGPDVFDFAEGAMVAHVQRDVLDESDRRDIEEAVRACPAQAISLQPPEC